MSTTIEQQGITPTNTNIKPSGIFATVLVTIAIITLISIALEDSTVFIKNTYYYVLPILFLVFCICVYFIYTFSSSERSTAFAVLFVAFICITTITLTVYFMRNIGFFELFTPNVILNILFSVIILLALAILYILFLNKLGQRGGWLSFIINFLFYIPCIFGDFFTYLLRDFVTTPKSVFHLLFAELIMIIIYFWFYPRIQKSTTDNGIVLVENPIMLNSKTRIDGPLYQSFYHKKNDPISNKVILESPLRTTFSISMWIFLNIQPFTQLSYTKEATIFEYSSPDISGCGCMNHPKVTYMNNTNGADQYIFYLAQSSDKKTSITYKKTLPHQKWNNIVFNYRDGAVDIFINGVFETTVAIQKPIKYTDMDTVSIGQYDSAGKERSGIYGAVCNIVYYRNILSQGQIATNYNLLSIKTPPV